MAERNPALLTRPNKVSCVKKRLVHIDDYCVVTLQSAGISRSNQQPRPSAFHALDADRTDSSLFVNGGVKMRARKTNRDSRFPAGRRQNLRHSRRLERSFARRISMMCRGRPGGFENGGPPCSHCHFQRRSCRDGSQEGGGRRNSIPSAQPVAPSPLKAWNSAGKIREGSFAEIRKCRLFSIVIDPEETRDRCCGIGCGRTLIAHFDVRSRLGNNSPEQTQIRSPWSAGGELISELARRKP
jgi:hypothetical protein